MSLTSKTSDVYLRSQSVGLLKLATWLIREGALIEFGDSIVLPTSSGE